MSTTTALSALSSIASDITYLNTTYPLYNTARTTATATLDQNRSITTDNSELDLKIRELNRQEDLLNKQFLDARKTATPTGFFVRLGLSSMQDWTLAAFFFTFGLFGMILTVFLASNSIYWGRVAIFGVVMTAILMGGSAILIRMLG